MKIQVTIDIDITSKLKADKEHVADVITTQLKTFLAKHLRNTENNVNVKTCVLTDWEASVVDQVLNTLV